MTPSFGGGPFKTTTRPWCRTDWRVKSGITHLDLGPSGGYYLSAKRPFLEGLVDSANELGSSTKPLGHILSPSDVPLVGIPGHSMAQKSNATGLWGH